MLRLLTRILFGIMNEAPSSKERERPIINEAITLNNQEKLIINKAL